MWVIAPCFDLVTVLDLYLVLGSGKFGIWFTQLYQVQPFYYTLKIFFIINISANIGLNIMVFNKKKMRKISDLKNGFELKLLTSFKEGMLHYPASMIRVFKFMLMETPPQLCVVFLSLLVPLF